MSTFTKAQPYVTGAVHFVVARDPADAGTANSQAPIPPIYLGTSEFSPYLEVDKQYVPLYNDLGGPLIPFDKAYAGKQAFVAADLTRLNWEGISRIMDDPIFSAGDLDEALNDGSSDTGTLILTEGYAFGLYLVWPYQAVQAYSRMYKGFHFKGASAPKITINRMGTQPVRVHVSWHCIRVFDGKTKKFSLGDSNIAKAQGVINS
jgi:hypothetical protein